MSQRLVFLAAASLAALPAAGAWDLVRGNEEVRVSVDTKSIKVRGAETRFTYLVDFRKPQGDAPGSVTYRSVVVQAAIRCQQQLISLRHTEAFTEFTGKGVSLKREQASPADAAFRPLEKGSSDEDLHQHVCKPKK